MPNCPFCGSENLKIDTPYIDRVTGEPKTSWCCPKQATNDMYAKKRFNPLDGERPTPEEVSDYDA